MKKKIVIVAARLLAHDVRDVWIGEEGGKMAVVRLRDLKRPLAFALLGVIPLAVGVRFITFLGHWIYLPQFPNLLDCLGLMVSGAVLLYLGARSWARVVRGK